MINNYNLNRLNVRNKVEVKEKEVREVREVSTVPAKVMDRAQFFVTAL